jgi:hypothetical protein
LNNITNAKRGCYNSKRIEVNAFEKRDTELGYGLDTCDLFFLTRDRNRTRGAMPRHAGGSEFKKKLRF